jgi:hypothetical protein
MSMGVAICVAFCSEEGLIIIILNIENDDNNHNFTFPVRGLRVTRPFCYRKEGAIFWNRAWDGESGGENKTGSRRDKVPYPYVEFVSITLLVLVFLA